MQGVTIFTGIQASMVNNIHNRGGCLYSVFEIHPVVILAYTCLQSHELDLLVSGGFISPCLHWAIIMGRAEQHQTYNTYTPFFNKRGMSLHECVMVHFTQV